MSAHPLPATGGGYPVMAMGKRIVAPIGAEEIGALILKLTNDTEAEATGREVVECIREACSARKLEDVATLYTLFRDVVTRVPEFHVLLAEFHDTDRETIARVLCLPKKGPGRPREDQFFFVALIEHVMDVKELEHANEAIDWLMSHRDELSLPGNYMPAAKTLQNKHAALARYYRLWSRSMYVSPDLLTLLPPLPPGIEPPPQMVERCRYPPTDGSPWPYGVRIEIRLPKQQ